MKIIQLWFVKSILIQAEATLTFVTYHRVCNYINTTQVQLVEYELSTLPEHLSSPTVFSGVRVTRSLVLYVCFVDRYVSSWPLIYWSLCCLSFFDLRILITFKTSSNSSQQYDETPFLDDFCFLFRPFDLLAI